jgi:hypothetical protein
VTTTTQAVLTYQADAGPPATGDVEANRRLPLDAKPPMQQADADLAPVIERPDYPPLLNVVMPVLMLVVSAAYAWSLRDMINPGMNLLLLKPIFVAIAVLLAIVFVKDVVPSIRLHRVWKLTAPRVRVPWRERFAPGTEAGAGLIVAATFFFSLYGPGHGAVAYLAGTFIYVLVVGYLIGDREPVWLILQAALCSTGLYLLMGVALGVRL